jgi:putative MATE family efflux protein
MNKNTKLLREEKIGKLLIRLSLPAMIGMMGMAAYNIVDTIFVGRGVGSMAIAGLAIVFPIQMLVMAFTQFIGIGGASIISRCLGAKDYEKANKTFANMITLVVIMGLLMTIIAYTFSSEILFIFGSKGEIAESANDYFGVILWGIPFFSFAMVSSNIIRAEGNAKVAMISMLVAASINLILDPIFIFVLHMGIKGVAFASVIAQFLSVGYLIYYFNSGQSVLLLKRKNLKLDKPIVVETFAIGASSFARQISISVMAAILNHSLIKYGGEITVAAFGIVHRVLAFIFMPLFGVVQGFLPIAGFNYGAGDYKRVREVIRISIGGTTAIAFTGFVVLMFFAQPILSIFSADILLINQGVHAMHIIILAFILIGFQIIGSGLFQALGKALQAFMLSISRQVLFLIPLVLILPNYFDLDGIWFAFPIADTLSVFVTLLFVIPVFRMLRQNHE